ncbi:MAG: ABC transporter substrate-binding protein [Anaerolineae bacterium]
MKARNWGIFLAVAAIVALIVTGCAPAQTTQPTPAAEPAAVQLPAEIVVGALEPLTGSHAVLGAEAKAGMEVAIEHINAAGGIQSLNGLKLKLVSEDAGENADSAKLGAESLISKHRPVAILGLYISRMTIAASEVTEREKVVLIADALVDSVTASGRRYLFRPAPKASQHGASAVQFVTSEAQKAGLEFKNVAILNEDSSSVAATQSAR